MSNKDKLDKSKKRNFGTTASFDLSLMKKNKFFKTLLGSYCVFMNYCSYHNIEQFVEDNVNSNDLIIEFVRFISNQEIEEQYDDEGFNVDAAISKMGTDS
jgi:hypothetical protein